MNSIAPSSFNHFHGQRSFSVFSRYSQEGTHNVSRQIIHCYLGHEVPSKPQNDTATLLQVRDVLYPWGRLSEPKDTFLACPRFDSLKYFIRPVTKGWGFCRPWGISKIHEKSKVLGCSQLFNLVHFPNETLVHWICFGLSVKCCSISSTASRSGIITVRDRIRHHEVYWWCQWTITFHT